MNRTPPNASRGTGGRTARQTVSRGRENPPQAEPTPPRREESDLKNNLQSQTPLNRRRKQAATPTEPGTVRRTRTQVYRVKQPEEREKSPFAARLLFVLLCYAILMPTAIGLFWMWLPRHTTPQTRDYTYQVGPDGDVLSKKTYSWDMVRNGNIYYLDMTGIAELCEMTTTGDSESLRYTVRENGDTAEFVLGQSLVYINGIPDRMEANCYLRNGRLYVPMDFVNRCFIGLSATLDSEKNKITVVRLKDENGDPAVLTFPFRQSVTSDPIDFSTLDPSILDKVIDPNAPPTPEPTPPASPTSPAASA